MNRYKPSSVRTPRKLGERQSTTPLESRQSLGRQLHPAVERRMLGEAQGWIERGPGFVPVRDLRAGRADRCRDPAAEFGLPVLGVHHLPRWT